MYKWTIWLKVKVTLEGQMSQQMFKPAFCFSSISPTFFTGFTWNLAHILSSLRQRHTWGSTVLSLRYASTPCRTFQKTKYVCIDLWHEIHYLNPEMYSYYNKLEQSPRKVGVVCCHVQFETKMFDFDFFFIYMFSYTNEGK